MAAVVEADSHSEDVVLLVLIARSAASLAIQHSSVIIGSILASMAQETYLIHVKLFCKIKSID